MGRISGLPHAPGRACLVQAAATCMTLAGAPAAGLTPGWPIPSCLRSHYSYSKAFTLTSTPKLSQCAPVWCSISCAVQFVCAVCSFFFSRSAQSIYCTQLH